MLPLLIVAHPSFPYRTAAEIVAAAKAKPGGIDLATAGPATSQHMSAELFAHRTGTQFNMVHYRGSGPAMADLLAGNVPLMFDSVASALGNIQAGKIIPIAVTTPDRAPQLPIVPTIAETVAPGYGAYGWTGLCGPAGLPDAIARKVNADLNAILREPAMQARFIELGGTAAPGTPEENRGLRPTRDRPVARSRPHRQCPAGGLRGCIAASSSAPSHCPSWRAPRSAPSRCAGPHHRPLRAGRV